MWTCPKCGRNFKNKDQRHSCSRLLKENLFLKRPPELKSLCDKVLRIVASFGDYREEAVSPDAIFLKTKSTFMAVKVKKDHLDIEFFLNRIEDIPPVLKHLQTSKNRVVHIVPIANSKDLTPQLKKWMRESYNLITG
jgi:hypothetical protein